MRQKTTQALYAYWNGVRKGRMAPQRLEIQPAHIAEQLPDTFILERADGRTFRYRLAGTRVCARFGIELRGLNFLDQWTEGDRAMLEHHIARITDLGTVGVFTVDAVYASGRRAAFEIVVLPLVHNGQAIDRLLCAMSLLEEHADGLGEEPLASMRLVAAEAVWPDGHPHALVARDGRQSPLEPHLRHARIVRHERRQFRVYDGGLHKDESQDERQDC